jgi:type IV pilus assembly PilN-like protein
MRAINLLPKQAIGQQRAGLGAKLPFVGSAAVPVVAAILVFVGYSSGHSALVAKQTQLAAVTAQLAATKPVISVASTPAPSTAGLVVERTQRLAALESVLGKEVAWDTTLLNVARVLPANVWLTSLTATSPTPADVVAPVSVAPTTTTTTPTPAPAAAASAAGFTIAGSTYNEEDVAALLRRLQLLPTLTNVTLVSTTQLLVGTKSLVQFNVTASLQPAPAPSHP